MAYLRELKTGRWSAQIFLGKDATTGKTRWETKSFKTKKEAEQWARSLETKRDEGQYRPSVSKVSLADYITTHWLPFYRTQVWTTYQSESVLRKWILTPQADTPFLGRIPLRKLTPAELTSLYAALDKHGLKIASIQRVHALLHTALQYAVKQQQLPSNPAKLAELPKPEKRKEGHVEDDESTVRYMSLEQAKRFREAAKTDRYAALWLLLLDAGLRPGEAAALQ